MDNKLVCPECAFEWTPEVEQEPAGLIVKDSNGNILADGDTVVVIKDLPVKGAPKAIKAGHQGQGHPPHHRRPQHRLPHRRFRADGPQVGVCEEGIGLRFSYQHY
jgi:hypothetical protein